MVKRIYEFEYNRNKTKSEKIDKNTCVQTKWRGHYL